MIYHDRDLRRKDRVLVVGLDKTRFLLFGELEWFELI